MAVLSFAHLKKNRTADQDISNHPSRTESAPSAPSTPKKDREGKQKTGVMSFAHLKGKKAGQERVQKHAEEQHRIAPEENPFKRRSSIFMIPAVMPTARIMAVNYCHLCPRFMPATDHEKEAGVNPYGRCRRDDDEDGNEVWRIIPETAIVKRCWYFIHE